MSKVKICIYIINILLSLADFFNTSILIYTSNYSNLMRVVTRNSNECLLRNKPERRL